MKIILFLTIIIAIVNFSVITSAAEDCEYFNEKKICWESSASTTLGWTSPQVTYGEYKIEARDFNWLGSVSIRVTKNDIVKEGILSEGESYIFDFSKGPDFEGVKIVGDKISNMNSFPVNIGTYPSDAQAKISFRLSVPEKKKYPHPGVSITTEGEQKAGSRITAIIKTENSGDSDLVDTQFIILFDDLGLMNEYDFEKGLFIEGAVYVPGMKWENAGIYKLTPITPNIVKNGFYIKVLNFLNNTALLSATYNLSTKNATLIEGESVIFDFPEENEYRSLKIFGKNITGKSAEFILQFPKKNSLKRMIPVISKDSSESVKLSFLLPRSSKKTFLINVKALGKDRQGNLYSASNSKSISLSNTFKIEKKVPNSILGEGLYPGSYYPAGNIGTIRNISYVTIRVENIQNYPVYGVQLIDTIPPGFTLVDDPNQTSLLWNFDIKANDNKEFRYPITARRMGVYDLPKAGLTWNEWGEKNIIESNTPRTQVSGPYVVIERSFNKTNVKPGDTLQVSLSISNTGDIPTKIKVSDIVPENATFLSGKLNFSGFIRSREIAKIVYTLLINESTLEFNAPEITSTNTGFDWYSPVPVKKINVISPSLTLSASSPVKSDMSVIVPDPPPYPPHDRVTGSVKSDLSVIVPDSPPDKGIFESISGQFPWLEDAIAIVTLLFGIFLLIILNRVP